MTQCSLNHKDKILFLKWGYDTTPEEMILRETVKNLLVCYPYYHGKISLPRPKYDMFTNFKICSGKYSIELIDTENRENVKKFMLGKYGKKYDNL